MPQASHCSCHEGRIQSGNNSVYHFICKHFMNLENEIYQLSKHKCSIRNASVHISYFTHMSEFKPWILLGNSVLYIINDNDLTFQCSVSLLMKQQYRIQIFYQEWKKTYLKMNEYNTSLFSSSNEVHSSSYLTYKFNCLLKLVALYFKGTFSND